MGGTVSSVSQFVGGFLIYRWKNVMDAHRSRLLGDGSFGHPGKLFKWMDLRDSPILHTLLSSMIFKI